MSSSRQGAPGDKKDEARGFKKFMRRASLVLRPKSKKQSVSSTSAFTLTQGPSSPTALASPSAATSTPTQAETSLPVSVPAQITQVIKDNKPTSTSIIRLTPKETSAIQEEKAKALFAKYGLILEPGEWTAPVSGGAPRIERRIRMRIHRTCHRCQTIFGSEKVCSNCQHTRCKKCPGRPSSKSKVARGIAVDEGATKSEGAMTMPHRASGKEVERRVPTQRVRRTCHECQTLFVGRAVKCEHCGHTRCPACPRDPPKSSKYPEGYPDDTEQTFPTEQSAMEAKQTEGSRPPRRPEGQAAVESVEERMKGLDVSPQASAA